jgi:flavin-dependent dehydrogenase
MAGATLGRVWACDASLYSSQLYAGPQFLLVGDAASCIEPLSSFGVKKAPASAWVGAVQIAGGRATPALVHAETAWNSRFPTDVWKVEYNSVLSNSLLLEVRAGAYKSLWARTGKSPDPRFEDIGNNFVSGVLADDSEKAFRPDVPYSRGDDVRSMQLVPGLRCHPGELDVVLR